MLSNNIVLFSGYAKLPSGTVVGGEYKMMALVALVDIRTGEIVEADCTLSTRLAERFVVSMMVGRKIHTDYKELVKSINNIYQGSAQRAIITALRILHTKFIAYLLEYEKLIASGRGNVTRHSAAVSNAVV